MKAEKIGTEDVKGMENRKGRQMKSMMMEEKAMTLRFLIHNPRDSDSGCFYNWAMRTLLAYFLIKN